MTLTISGIYRSGTFTPYTGVADTSGNILQLTMFPFEVVTLQTVLAAFPADLKIYPNPGTGTFYLDAAGIGAQITGLKLLDTSSRSVSLAYSISRDQIEITTKAMPGVYYLLIKHKEGSQRSVPVLIR